MQGELGTAWRADGLAIDFGDIVADWSLPVMVLDPEMRFVYANSAYQRAIGKEWAELSGRYIFEALPEGPERQAVVADSFRRALSGEATRLREVPYAVPGANGDATTRYWDVVNTPVKDFNTGITYMAQHAEDVTDEVVKAQTHAMLAQELNHRTRNLLMVVGTLARLAARESTDKAAFVNDFTRRIDMMSRVHKRLYQNDFKGAPLRDLLADEIAYFGSDGAFVLHGPHVDIDEHKARDLSLVLHELATNAAKHGCFSGEDGHLSVAWRLTGQDLVIDWVETGLGAVNLSSSRGFGSKLIEMLPNIRCTRRGTDDGIEVVIECTGFGGGSPS